MAGKGMRDLSRGAGQEHPRPHHWMAFAGMILGGLVVVAGRANLNQFLHGAENERTHPAIEACSGPLGGGLGLMGHVRGPPKRMGQAFRQTCPTPRGDVGPQVRTRG